MSPTYSGPAPSRRSITDPLIQREVSYDKDVAAQEAVINQLNNKGDGSTTYDNKGTQIFGTPIYDARGNPIQDPTKDPSSSSYQPQTDTYQRRYDPYSGGMIASPGAGLNPDGSIKGGVALQQAPNNTALGQASGAPAMNQPGAYQDPRNPTGYIPKGAVIGGAAKATDAYKGRGQAALPPIDSIKGYIETTRYDAQGNPFTVKTEEGNATKEAQLKEMQRRTIQQQNDLKSAEINQREKDKIAKYDATKLKVDETKGKFDDMKAQLKGMSPEVQAAYTTQIDTLQNQFDGIDAEMARIFSTFQSDAQIEGAYAGQEQRAKDIEKRFLDLSDRNLETAKQVAQYNKDMLEVDKKIMEQRQTEDEHKQIVANVQNEKRLRRQLNALGIQTDLQGLDFLQTSIQEGQTNLANLRATNDLNRLKANLAIGEGYRLEVQQALDKYEGDYLSITTQTDDKLSAIRNSISLDKASRNKEMRDTLKWGAEKKNDLELKVAEAIKEANVAMAQQLKEEAKARQDAIIKTKDTIGFISDVSKEIGNNKIIQNGRAVVTQYTALKNEYSRAQRSTAEGKQFSDQTLISLFNKILDPTSVVREAEYNRSAENMSLADRAWATFQKYADGGVLNPKVREELFNAATVLNETYEKQLQDEFQPYISRANVFNSQGDLQTPVKLTDIFPPSLIPYVPDDTVNMWKTQMNLPDQGTPQSYNTSGTENPEGFVGWLSPDKAPALGFRTDRHNNPTAFTTDVAKQAGLKEGVDYVYDEALANGFPTAKLLGDPIATTIQVIDKIGFYTQSGKPRWTHTAISKADWDSKTLAQKTDLVVKMYQREGGSGILAQGITGSPQVASAPAASTPAPQQPDFRTAMNQNTAGPLRSGGTLAMNTAQLPQAPQIKGPVSFRTNSTGGITTVSDPDQIRAYLNKPDLFTRI